MKLWQSGFVALAVALAPSTVMAQQNEAAGDDQQPEVAAAGDIVVTATRVSSLASETPIALTAVTGENLINQGITNPTQLEAAVPNLSIVRDNGLQITIRGVTSNDDSEKGDPSAAFLSNDVYIARPQAQEVSFFDVERIEVLRGPQGTLYGRNTTAGLVNIITRRPEFRFGARGEAIYESFNHLVLSGAVNVPVGDALAIRAAANLDRRDSYVINGTNDGVDYDPFKDNLSGRLSVRAKPTQNLTIDVIGDYSDIGGKMVNSVPLKNFYAGVAPGKRPTFTNPASEEARTTTFGQLSDPVRDNKDYGVTGQVEWRPGDATLTYIGSYREFKRDETQTIVGGFVPARYLGNYSQTSHEVRLAWTGIDRLQAQIGAYYFHEKSNINLTLLNPRVLGLPAFATNYQFVQGPTGAENQSAFGQASYEIVDRVSLTLGARYSHDQKSRVGETAFDTLPQVMIPGNRIVLQRNSADRSFNKVTWRAGIDWRSPIGLVYGSVATGYKAGGFNDGCETGTAAKCALTADALYYAPETLTAYEAGVKLATGDRKFRLNAAAFHYDYNNLQLSQLSNACGAPCQITRNAARARVDGVELEGIVTPIPALRFDLGLNLLKARYVDFVPAPGVNYSARPLSRSPDVTVQAGVSYTYRLANAGALEASARTRFSSEYDLTDLQRLIGFYQPSFTKTDVTLTYRAPDDRFTLGAFARNIENAITVTNASSGVAVFDGSATFADPRTIGVRAGFSF